MPIRADLNSRRGCQDRSAGEDKRLRGSAVPAGGYPTDPERTASRRDCCDTERRPELRGSSQTHSRRAAVTPEGSQADHDEHKQHSEPYRVCRRLD